MKTLEKTLEKIAGCGALMGFLLVSSGCVIVPGHDHDGGRDRDHERDRGEYHCDRDRGDHCHDRFR